MNPHHLASADVINKVANKTPKTINFFFFNWNYFYLVVAVSSRIKRMLMTQPCSVRLLTSFMKLSACSERGQEVRSEDKIATNKAYAFARQWTWPTTTFGRHALLLSPYILISWVHTIKPNRTLGPVIWPWHKPNTLPMTDPNGSWLPRLALHAFISERTNNNNNDCLLHKQHCQSLSFRNM